MFCKQCGAELKDGDRFCPQCAAPVEQEARERVQAAQREEPMTNAAVEAMPAAGGTAVAVLPKKKKTVLIVVPCILGVLLVAVVAMVGWLIFGNKDRIDEKRPVFDISANAFKDRFNSYLPEGYAPIVFTGKGIKTTYDGENYYSGDLQNGISFGVGESKKKLVTSLSINAIDCDIKEFQEYMFCLYRACDPSVTEENRLDFFEQASLNLGQQSTYFEVNEIGYNLSYTELFNLWSFGALDKRYN